MTAVTTDEFWERTMALVADLDSRSYYQLLGVEPQAEAEAISSAYYLLVKTVHPDRHALETNPDRRKALVRLYARIGEAFRVLRSHERRRMYDAELAAGKKRLDRDAEQRGRAKAAEPDPKTPHGKMLYDRGRQLIDEGDRKGGRAQLSLAAQFEPNSRVIRAAIDALDEPKKPAAPSPAATPAPEPPAPEVQAASPAAEVQPPRAPLVTLRCATWDQVVALGARIAGGERIFLRAQNPARKGAELPVALRLPDRETLSLRAVVDEVVTRGSSGSGMRLIVEADDDDLDALQALVSVHKPPNTAALRAREAFDHQRYTEARESYEQALAAEPEARSLRVGYYLALGYEALSADMTAEARIHFRTAQLLDDSSVEAAEAVRVAARKGS